MDKLFELAQNGDKSSFNLLVEQNSGLVHSVVSRFMGRGVEYDDLYQMGCIGLCKAVARFDGSLGYKFSTYAVPLIMGEIRRFLRDDGIIKVSRRLKETAQKAGLSIHSLRESLGREPTVSEVSQHSGIAEEELTLALDATRAPESIYGEIGEDGQVMDKIAADDESEEERVNRIAVRQALKNTDENEQRLIIYRYFEDKTQSETARLLGISQVQVSRLEKKILAKMRKELSC